MIIIDASYPFKTKTGGERNRSENNSWTVKSTHTLAIFTLKPGHNGWSTSSLIDHITLEAQSWDGS